MKILITENRMIELVGHLVSEVFPNFNREDALSMSWSNGDETYIEYYDPHIKGNKGVFAKYWLWKEELQLNRELFETLEGHFGDDMTYVIDWFNNEFDRDAESVTF